MQISLFAQQPISIHLTEKDGLPDIEFYDIIEDKKGFIWLAADKGLYRYDGKNFKNYSNPEKKGLSVFGLKFDDKGRLWCNNVSGQFFYIEKDTLKYFTDLKNKNLGQLAPFLIKKNKIYSYVKNLGFEIDIETKQTKILANKSSSYKAFFSHNDSLFYSQEKSVYVKKNESYIAIDTINNLKSFIKSYGTANLIVDSLGKSKDIVLQAVDYDRKIKRFFLRKNFKFKQLSNQELNLDAYVNDSFVENNNVWFATSKGVYNYIYNDGKFVLKGHFYKDKIVTSILKDKNDNYWFTTHRNGVFIVPNINLRYNQEASIHNITALAKNGDTGFIYGTTKGELVSGSIHVAKLNKLPTISNKKTHVIARNPKNKLLISYSDGAYLYDNGTSEKVTGLPLNMNGAKGISFINEDKLILGTYAFSSIVNLKTKTSNRIGFRRSYTVHYNKNIRTIYVGYVDGVEYYKKDLSPQEILFKGKPIFALAIDHTNDNTVWISTFSNGIIGVRNGKVIENYTIQNGLLSNQTRLVKGDGNNLWVVTDKGIQYLNTETNTLKSITKQDGLSSFNISDIVIFDEKVVFATNNGLFEFNKTAVFKSVKLSDFYFTNVLVEDEKVVIKDKYDLASKVNKIQFQFHTNGILAEENINYKYRLLGASNEWTNVPNKSNQITFNSLSAGNYTFQLKKVSSISNKETSVKSIKIKINKPFYQEWWFLSSILTLISFFVIRYYKKKLKEKETEKKTLLTQAEKEKELVFLKLENLRSQMNPHFIFNALNSIQDYILLNQKNLAGDYLGKFADLIRMYLYHSTKSYISLEEEIRALDQYLELEKLRFEERLNYSIKTEEIIDIETIKIPTMLVQPYLENAIKHGLLHKKEAGIVRIEFILEKKFSYLKCIITDNGIGREKAKEFTKRSNPNHKSFATQANKDRLSLLNFERKEKIGVEIIDLYSNDIAIGTQVFIKIPYKKI